MAQSRAKTTAISTGRRSICFNRKELPRQLERALVKAWSQETSFDPSGWSRHNPAWGQCAVTALIVQDHLGGKLISGKVNGIPHYWNRLAADQDIDLTIQQFGKTIRRAGVKECERDYVLSFPETQQRYQRLQERVTNVLTPSRA